MGCTLHEMCHEATRENNSRQNSAVSASGSGLSVTSTKWCCAHGSSVLGPLRYSVLSRLLRPPLPACPAYSTSIALKRQRANRSARARPLSLLEVRGGRWGWWSRGGCSEMVGRVPALLLEEQEVKSERDRRRFRRRWGLRMREEREPRLNADDEDAADEEEEEEATESIMVGGVLCVPPSLHDAAGGARRRGEEEVKVWRRRRGNSSSK